MSDLVEKVSRAIAPHWWAGVDAATEYERSWLIGVHAHVSNVSLAKAVVLTVLEAIREPTKEMIEAAETELAKDTDCRAFDRHYAGLWDAWRVMVDAKRKEIEEE